MRMVGKQRRRPTGVNKENRPVIVKAFLADAVYQTRHRFAGIYRIQQHPLQARQQFTASIPASLARRNPGQNSHPINEYPPSPSAPADRQ